MNHLVEDPHLLTAMDYGRHDTLNVSRLPPLLVLVLEERRVPQRFRACMSICKELKTLHDNVFAILGSEPGFATSPRSILLRLPNRMLERGAYCGSLPDISYFDSFISRHIMKFYLNPPKRLYMRGGLIRYSSSQDSALFLPTCRSIVRSEGSVWEVR